MVKPETISLENLSLDELAGVVNLYPWYGAARKQLCLRMSRLGQDALGPEQYAEAALYVGSRRKIADIARNAVKGPATAAPVKEILRKPRVIVVGGDYFSSDQYATVKEDGDSSFSGFASAGDAGAPRTDTAPEPGQDSFCTETLAEIYAEQGHFAEAKRIYSRLLLVNPEKSAYFAALIEKLN